MASVVLASSPIDDGLEESVEELAAHPLHRLFAAESIAVIGASADPARIGGRPIEFLRQAGFAGRIHPVNPRHEVIQGLAAYPTISAVPDVVDVAIIAVDAAQAVDVVEECGRCGVGFAVMFTAGFAEVGGDGVVLQQQLREVAERVGIRVVGPNSIGFASSPSRIVGSFGSAWVRPGSLPLAEGSVSFVTHSGAFGVFIYAMAQDSGVAFRHFANLGNEVDVSFTEALDYMVADPGVKAVGGYIEGIDDGDHFAEVAHRANHLGKPLVMLKVGRSARSRRAAASHTASLTGEDAVYQAVFDECNVIRVEGVQHLLDILALCQHGFAHPADGSAGARARGVDAVGAPAGVTDDGVGAPAEVADGGVGAPAEVGGGVEPAGVSLSMAGGGTGRGVATGHEAGIGMLSISGGAGVWAVDQIERLGLRVADFDATTIDRLDELLPAFGSSNNPVDATAQLVNQPEMLAGVLETIMADTDVGLTLVLMGLQESSGGRLARDVVDVARTAGAPIVVGWVGGPAVVYEVFADAGIPVFPDFTRALEAIAAVNGYVRRRRRLAEASGAVDGPWRTPAPPGGDAPMASTAGGSVASTAGASGVVHADALAEHDAKRRLARHGLPVPTLQVVRSAEEAVAAAVELGDPVVVKAAAHGRILHKTDLGVLRAGVTGDAAVRTAYDEVAAQARARIGADASVFVESQAPDGVEMIVTLLRDDVFGPYLVVGLGGELVEIIGEAGLHRAPATAAQVARLLDDHPRIRHLLGGVRGRPPADVSAFIDLVVGLGGLAAAPGGSEIDQIECNPVRVHTEGSGATILDVVWTRRDA